MTSDHDAYLTRYKTAPVNLLAIEVAKGFGGMVEVNRDGEFYEAQARVLVPAHDPMPAYTIGLRVGFKGGGYNGKLTASLYSARINNDIHTADLTWPTAGISMSKDTQAVCAEISRRVVNHRDTLATLRTYEERRAKLEARDKGLAAHLADILAANPHVHTSQNEPLRPGASSARLYGRGTPGQSFDATLYPDGSMSLDRVYSIPNVKARRIIALLRE